MRNLLRCAVLLLPTAIAGLAHAEGQDIRACDFKLKAGCVIGSARVTLVDGIVKSLDINVYWCGLPHRPGYTCLIDSSRGDEDSQWSQEGGATLIANKSPFNPDQPDRVRVTVVGGDVSIDLHEAQSPNRCGAGAELPRSIVIPAQGKACRVRLGEP